MRMEQNTCLLINYCQAQFQLASLVELSFALILIVISKQGIVSILVEDWFAVILRIAAHSYC